MAYSTNEDLLNQMSFEELARLSGDDTGAAVDEDRIDEARRNADALTDTFLNGRYTLPFESVPEIIRTISIELTVYFLNEYKFRDSMISPAVIAIKDNSLKLLSLIQNGDLKIATTGTNPPEIITNKSNNKIFKGNRTDVFFS